MIPNNDILSKTTSLLSPAVASELIVRKGLNISVQNDYVASCLIIDFVLSSRKNCCLEIDDPITSVVTAHLCRLVANILLCLGFFYFLMNKHIEIS
jgi:hypothetical protein